MLDEETLATARRIAKRYGSHPRFDRDDAYQSAVLALLERPEDHPGRKVLRLRRGVAEGFAGMGYVTRLPLSKLTQLRSTGSRLPLMEGSTDTEVLAYQGCTDHEEHERIEDQATAASILADATDEERRVLRFFMDGKRPAYKTRAADKEKLTAALDRLRSVHRG